MSSTHYIDQQIKAYKAKYFKQRLLKGSAIFLAVVFATFITFSLFEHIFHFGQTIRAILFFSFIGGFIYLLYKLILRHVVELFNLDASLSDEAAARQIGSNFPGIGDKLLNLVQLRNFQANSLAVASVSQRSGFLQSYNFTHAVKLKDTSRYWKIAGGIILFIIILSFFQPEILYQSPERIIQYNKEFIAEAPFTFNVKHQRIAYKNEDYLIQVELKGKAIPAQAYLITASRKIKLNQSDNQSFTHAFPKIQQDITFKIEAAGYQSKTYDVKVVNRPTIGDFNIIFEFPEYINRENMRLENTGHFQIPQGTKVTWQIQPKNTDQIKILFVEQHDSIVSKVDDQVINFERTLMQSTDYVISMQNSYGSNKEPIIYNAEVIEDRYPELNVNFYQDTILYSFIMMSGNVSDDYGIGQLKLFYRLKDESENFAPITIPVSTKESSQSFAFEWLLDSLKIAQGKTLQYYLQVWDNDAVNGNKSSKTGVYTLQIPDNEAIKEAIGESREQTQEQISKTLLEAQEVKKQLEETAEKLKGKKQLTWQDEKQLKDLIKKREELNKSLEEIKEKHANQELQRERFKEQDESLREKAEQLQKLMDELLDEETKKLYEELKKLLEDQKQSENVQEMLQKMQNKENNLEKELERALELFKRLEFEHKLDENIKELEELKKEQQKVSEKTEDKKQPSEELAKEQEELNNKFEQLKEDMKQMEELNQDLKQPELLPEDLKEQQESIEKTMDDAKQQLQNNNRKESQQQQQQTVKEMEELKEKLSQMQSSMEMEMMMENINDLRHIVHNLLKLSFNQEELMKQFDEVQQSDPRFVTLAQQQLKITNDSKILQDSLSALASRVFQIQSFVTRELSKMNDHLDQAATAIKERKKPVAVSEQQFAMTSMNNLALLLDDVLQQMQNAMAEAMGKPSPGNKNPKTPSLGQMQQQLNQQIQDLKKSGKTGRQLSEELAKLAAQQERIRKALQEMQEKFGKDGTMPGEGIPEQMEETEKDLVNKKITEETLKRQQDIVVRLLEAEKSMRERELDEERKGKSADKIEREFPPSFEEYFKQKEQEIELLKTIPPKLFPYYRKEVNEYFKRLGEQREQSNGYN